jgi:hypothetical protein
MVSSSQSRFRSPRSPCSAVPTLDVVYGVGEASAQLVPDEAQPGLGFPYMAFTCFGDMPLAVAYRVTIQSPAG